MWDDSDDRFEFSDDVWAESFVTGSGTLTITDSGITDSNSALNLASSSGRVSLQADGITGNTFYVDSSSGTAEAEIQGMALHSKPGGSIRDTASNRGDR